MRVVTAQHFTYGFRPDVEPVHRVQPGEIVRFEMSSAMIDERFDAGDRWLDIRDPSRVNPVSGPVYIEGVVPGDSVTIEILDIEVPSWGWSIAGFEVLPEYFDSPLLQKFSIENGRIWISDTISMPVRPNIGCLGLAPSEGVSSTLSPVYPWGGNYDLRQAEPGNTILFPAQVPGGLVFIGDLHAAMGAAEAVGVSIECVGGATVRLGVRKDLRLTAPRVESSERVYMVGVDPLGDLSVARQRAVQLVFDYLVLERQLDPADASALFAGCVDLELGGPAAAIVVSSAPLSLST